MNEEAQRCPISAKEAIDTIEAVTGKFPNHRRAHAKGIGLEATFSPNGAATPYTTAYHLQNEDIPAVVRFSHSSPDPETTEQLVPVKGMAVQFRLPEGAITNLTMATIPVFITETPESFIKMIQVFQRNKLPFSEKLSVLKNNPDFGAGIDILKNILPPKSFATGRYYAIHTYYLINAAGQKQAVKFEWEPADDPLKESNELLISETKDLMEIELLARLTNGPVRFKLVIHLGEAGDPINDSTQVWPEDRAKLVIGILTIHAKRADNAEQFVFDPTIVTDGLACSDDPVLKFRSAAYAESARRRLP